MVINDSIQRSVRALAHQYGIGTAAAAAPTAPAGGTAPVAAPVQTRPHRLVNREKPMCNRGRRCSTVGAIARLHMTVDEVNKAFETRDKAAAAEHPEKGPGDDTFVNLYTALVASLPSAKPAR